MVRILRYLIEIKVPVSRTADKFIGFLVWRYFIKISINILRAVNYSAAMGFLCGFQAVVPQM